MSAYFLIKYLHFIDTDLFALYFADDGSLFGILYPSRQAQLIACILAELGEVDAYRRHGCYNNRKGEKERNNMT